MDGGIKGYNVEDTQEHSEGYKCDFYGESYNDL
jgi:hypothetical protein